MLFHRKEGRRFKGRSPPWRAGPPWCSSESLVGSWMGTWVEVGADSWAAGAWALLSAVKRAGTWAWVRLSRQGWPHPVRAGLALVRVGVAARPAHGPLAPHVAWPPATGRARPCLQVALPPGRRLRVGRGCRASPGPSDRSGSRWRRPSSRSRRCPWWVGAPMSPHRPDRLQALPVPVRWPVPVLEAEPEPEPCSLLVPAAQQSTEAR
ncbi:hypothetical protein SAMN05216359_11476 [Roseateles sp. YR242]|nr:hypothetical protein SAMN05216359_11476 [Roseateles sp. YR242]